MSRAIIDLYFIMFRPEKEQARAMCAKSDSLFLLKELFTWHKVGTSDRIESMEKAEKTFEDIIIKYGDKNGIRQRYFEGRGQEDI